MIQRLDSELKVLIVDDSKTSAILVKQQLVGLGLIHTNLYTATHCEEAIELLNNHYFNVIIVDYHLEQTLTGFEFSSILYRNRLINDKVAVLIISGDSRQETVLTALSGRVRHFITKPIQTNALHSKLNSLIAETQLMEKFAQLQPIDSELKLEHIHLLLSQSDCAIAIESVVIDHLLQLKHYELLNQLLIFSNTNLHASKMVASAMLLAQQQRFSEAIDEVHQYLIENPLSLKLLDCLSYLYERTNQLTQALHWAVKAFELTPSLSERAITASTLAARTNQRDVVIKIGYTYACHLSLADSNWSHSVSAYFQALEATYVSADQRKAKKALLKHVSNFVTLASRRLTTKRRAQMNAMMTLFQCHILIHEHNDKVAHQKLLKGMSFFYDDLSKCPTSILNQFLPALLYFGESDLYFCFKSLLQQRGHHQENFDKLHRLYRYSGTEFSLNHLASTDIGNIDAHLSQYPHSVEAKLYYLHMTPKTMRSTERVLNYMSDLSKLTLPPNWHQWALGKPSSARFSTQPPKPFSLSLNATFKQNYRTESV